MICGHYPIQIHHKYFQQNGHFQDWEVNFYYLNYYIYYKKYSSNILHVSFQTIYVFGMLKYLSKYLENYLL